MKKSKVIICIVLFYVAVIGISLAYAHRVNQIDNGTFKVISDEEMEK